MAVILTNRGSLEYLRTNKTGVETQVSTPALVYAAAVLVTPITVFVTVREPFAEILAIEFPVSEARAVIFGCLLIGAFIAVIKPLTATAIFASCADAVV